MKTFSKTVMFFIVFLPLLASSQQRWENIIYTEGSHYGALSNTITYDNGQIILVAYDGNGTHKNLMFKLDKNGDMLWRKYLFFGQWSVPSSVKQNTLGETVLVGETGGKASMELLDACGNLLWCNTFTDNGYAETSYTDVTFTSDGNIVGLMSVMKENYDYDMGLAAFDTDGNFLWFHPFNLQQFNIGNLLLFYNIKSFDDFLIVSGFMYYAYPDNPNLGLEKPVFIKTDSNYNQDWLLYYGLADSSVNDTVLGEAVGILNCKNGILHGWGRIWGPSSYYSALYYFDTLGNQTNYYVITNEMIDSTVNDNFFEDLAERDDTTYFASMKYGSLGVWYNPVGELIIDTTGNVFQHQLHPEAKMLSGMYPLERDTAANQYYLAYQNDNWDILLYKFNADLSDAEIDTLPHTYDSLCPNLPIPSDTIYVTGCDVITQVPQFPSPEAYNRARQTVRLTAYPNPAGNGRVNFKLQYTQYHRNMQLAVYDMAGRQRLTLPLFTGQKEATASTAGLSPGLYVAVVRNENGVLGKAAFSVE